MWFGIHTDSIAYMINSSIKYYVKYTDKGYELISTMYGIMEHTMQLFRIW